MNTQQMLDEAQWGTGYGSKKHLVDHARSKLRVPGLRWSFDEIHVRCSATICVDFLDSRPGLDQELLASRKPCVLCQKLADAEAAQ